MLSMELNAIFGDGCTVLQKSGKRSVIFSSTNAEVIYFKSKLIGARMHERSQDPKAWGKKKIYCTQARLPDFCVDKLTRINDLSLEDLFLWFVDDGSYHKNKHYLNLCSHALTKNENEHLINHLREKLGIEARLRSETKQDGRQFYYLCIVRRQMEFLKPLFRQFLIANDLTSMLYKTGQASQTIERAALSPNQVE